MRYFIFLLIWRSIKLGDKFIQDHTVFLIGFCLKNGEDKKIKLINFKIKKPNRILLGKSKKTLHWHGDLWFNNHN